MSNAPAQVYVPENATVITADEALEVLAVHGGYGRVRVYGTLAESEECAGQMASIKSKYNLDERAYDAIYKIGNDGMVPIRRA